MRLFKAPLRWLRSTGVYRHRNRLRPRHTSNETPPTWAASRAVRRHRNRSSAMASARDIFRRTLASAKERWDPHASTDEDSTLIRADTTYAVDLPQSTVSREDAFAEYLLEESDLEDLKHYDVKNPFRKKVRRYYKLSDIRSKSKKRHGNKFALEQKKAEMRLADSGFAAPDSSHVVTAALWGNAVVLIGKTGAFIVSGSGAMLSEAIHTLADLGNQMLLKYGIQQSDRLASPQAPYGYASERYIFGLVSGVGIFFIGCGVTVYHGIMLLCNPQDVVSMPLALSVLVGSGIVEGLTFAVALKQVRKAAKHHRMSLLDFVKHGPDPLGVAVMMEDGAAVVGVGIATTCLGLVYVTGNHVWDAVGTIGIGGLLGMVAMFLISKNRQMLVGMSVPRDRLKAVTTRLLQEDSVRSLHDVRAVVVGSDEIRFKAEIHFDGSRLAALLWERDGLDLQRTLEHIRTPEDLRQHLLFFGDEVVEALGEEVDRLEDVVREELPEARYVDLETW